MTEGGARNRQDTDDGQVDIELVSSARAGDKSAFAELLGRHRPTAIALAGRALVDADLARDAVQEATVVALVSLQRLRSPDAFGPWFCGITLNVVRRWLRQPRLIGRSGDAMTEATAVAPDEAVEAAEIARVVRSAVLTLPPGQREAVLLFYWQGLTHAEMAAELGISTNAVKARLHQARAKLQPTLDTLRPLEEVPDMAQRPEAHWVDVAIAEIRRAPREHEQYPWVHVAILQEQGGTRQLPIWIGAGEGTALAANLESMEMPRPMTYQLAASLLGATGSQVTEVRITRLVETTYYAVIGIDGPGGPTEVDARPSDGLNLALVAGAPIRVDETLLNVPAGRDVWKRYPTTTRDIVAEMRERQAQLVALIAEVCPPEDDSST